MDNFDLRNFLAEGKLHENTEALSREEVVDMAQKIADEFSYEDAQEGGSSMVYMVGNVDGMHFELDTKATNRTPEEDAKYGTGEGMGGNFRIDVKPNGYEIRNSEKGGLVAIMDMENGFKILSADESRAEMGLEEAEEAPKSNKMKKSELKEMIRAAMLAEMEVEETEVFEAEEDEEVEVDVEDEVEVDTDADMEMDADVDGINVKQDADAELGGTIGDVQDNLEAALEAARALGDEKLEDQIGNTLTFFTRQHVVK
jgi:hypothetical protein